MVGGMNESVSQERIREELHKMFKHNTAKIRFYSKQHPQRVGRNFIFKSLLKPTLEKENKVMQDLQGKQKEPLINFIAHKRQLNIALYL